MMNEHDFFVQISIWTHIGSYVCIRYLVDIISRKIFD